MSFVRSLSVADLSPSIASRRRHLYNSAN